MEANLEKEISQWIQFSKGLNDLELLALIGLHELDPKLTTEEIDKGSIVGEKKCHRAGVWLSNNFYDLAMSFCVARVKFPGRATIELSKIVAAVLTSTVSVPVAIAVPFCLWALDDLSSKWCTQNKPVTYSGTGEYLYGLYDHDDIGLEGVEKSSVGLAKLTRYPKFFKEIEDNDYKDARHKIRINVVEKFEGTFKPDIPTDAAILSASFSKREVNSVKFKDSNGREIDASVDTCNLDVGSKILHFNSRYVTGID